MHLSVKEEEKLFTAFSMLVLYVDLANNVAFKCLFDIELLP